MYECIDKVLYVYVVRYCVYVIVLFRVDYVVYLRFVRVIVRDFFFFSFRGDESLFGDDFLVFIGINVFERNNFFFYYILNFEEKVL